MRSSAHTRITVLYIVKRDLLPDAGVDITAQPSLLVMHSAIY